MSQLKVESVFFEIVEELNGCINIIIQYGGSGSTGVKRRYVTGRTESRRPGDPAGVGCICTGCCFLTLFMTTEAVRKRSAGAALLPRLPLSKGFNNGSTTLSNKINKTQIYEYIYMQNRTVS